MRIQHNIMAMNAYRNYNNNVSAMRKNLEKLSSGYKINRAGDDAAGLAISEKMRAQITGLETAQKNAKDGISLVQTAEGALTEVHDMLNRMVTLATQSANGTYDNEVDRVQLQKELDQLRTEIDRIADSANFNGIKLFDGSLSGADITVDGITSSSIDMAKGVEVVQGTNGGGSKGVFTITLDSALTKDDQLTLKFGGVVTDATKGMGGDTLTLTYDPTTAGTVNATNANIAVADDIAGQAKNIASVLKNHSAIGSQFDVVANGNTITLTSKIEGSKTTGTDSPDDPLTSTLIGAEISSANNKSAVQGGSSDWKLVDGVDVNDGVEAFAGVIEDNAGGGYDLNEGDTVEIEVTLSNGKKVTVSAVCGEDFEHAETNKKTYENLKNYLNGTAVMNDNEDTVVDESKIKFGDLYDVSLASDGTDKTLGLKFTQQSSLVGDIDGSGTSGTISLSIAGQKVTQSQGSVVKNNASGSTAAAAEFQMKLDTTNGASNLGIGDTLKIEGQLSDGRKFEFTVEAGKDFKVASTYQDTMNNLKKLLEGDTFKVELQDSTDGSKTSVSSSEIFGDTAEIKIDTITNATTPKFVSTAKGEKASQVTNVTLTAADPNTVSTKLKNGDQRSSADSVITFSEGVGYGTTVEVGGRKYELVKNAGDISNGQNKAVVVDDITNVTDVASALAKALKADLNDKEYKVTTNNGSVTISTTKIGSSAKAITASASGDKTTQLEFTLDPKRMQEGTTVTINGQTYEFVNKGGKVSNASNQKIEVADISKETAASLGDALAKAAHTKNNASVTVDEDGLVKVRGLVNEKNEIVTPTVKFDGGTNGLTLQIGDTADDYNKMKVSIYKMHVADMGIGDISILDQDSAGAAIDKIRSAINYVSDVRGTLGATQNRLDHTINNLSVMQENIQDAESTIRDTDVASEMMAYTKNNILIQSAQAMLAQANQVPQGVLQLLQ